MSWTRTKEQFKDRPPFENIEVIHHYWKPPSEGDCLRVSTYRYDDEPLPFSIHLYLQESEPSVYKKYEKHNLAEFSTFDHSSPFIFSPKENFEIEATRMKKFIDIFLEHHHLIGTDMHSDLYSLCFLNQSIEVHKLKLLELIEDGELDKAIKTAIAYQNEEYCFAPIWYLAEEVYKRSLPLSKLKAEEKTILFGLFDSISEKNPYFKLAQKRMLELISIIDHQKNHIQILEKKFIIALNADEQSIADITYNELCGNSPYAKPAVTNISGDANTLLQIAIKMRYLNALNETLVKRNIDLNQKIRTGKSKTSIWKTPEDKNKFTDKTKKIEATPKKSFK